MDPPNSSLANIQKRKAASKLSTNPHTVKARNRKEKLAGAEATIDKAKAADAANVAYYLKKLKLLAKYQLANPTKQERMIAKVTKACVKKR